MGAETWAFLFTDVEGSTRRWDQDPQTMAADLAVTDGLGREVVARLGGVVVKSTGDGLFAAFSDTGAAVAAATELVVDAPLPLRAGIHTGQATRRDDDLFGPDVTRAARVGAAANSGQVLLSNAAAGLIDGRTVELVDLGEHLLRGFERPERLWQLIAAGLSVEILEPHADEVPVRLPEFLSSFVARADDEKTVRELVSDHRLVTVTGVGGTGKTRLAVTVGAQLASTFPDGVTFVDLAPVATDDGVGHALASALAAGRDIELDDRAAALRSLRNRRAVLVVDNCEQVIDAAAELVAQIQRDCPTVHVLATSREALGLEGERTYRAPPLPASSAAELFADRAGAADASFELARHADAIAEICGRLDGLPLAIELAAARVGVLTPEEMVERLDDRFALLTGRARGRAQRQQTLAAALDWSHDLLDDPERQVFRRLAVFAGGFRLRAAEELCADLDVDVLGVLESLVAKSLVDHRGDGRFRLLETMRLYAQDRLVDSGEAHTARDRHAQWVLDWFHSLPLGLRTFNARTGLDLAADIDNLRTAIDWKTTTGDWDAAAHLLGGAPTLWWNTRHFAEADDWATQVLDHDLSPPARAEALVAGCHTAFMSAVTRPKALDTLATRAHQLLDLADAAGDDYLAGIAHNALALESLSRRDADGFEAAITEAGVRFERIGDQDLVQWGRLMATHGHFLRTGVFDPTEAEAVDNWAASMLRAAAHYTAGRPDRAAASLGNVDPILDDDALVWSYAFDGLRAVVLSAAGQQVAARHHLRRVASRWRAEPGWGTRVPGQALVALACLEGDLPRAARLAGITLSSSQRGTTPLGSVFTHHLRTDLDGHRDAVAAARSLHRPEIIDAELARRGM